MTYWEPPEAPTSLHLWKPPFKLWAVWTQGHSLWVSSYLCVRLLARQIFSQHLCVVHILTRCVHREGPSGFLPRITSIQQSALSLALQLVFPSRRNVGRREKWNKSNLLTLRHTVPRCPREVMMSPPASHLSPLTWRQKRCNTRTCSLPFIQTRPSVIIPYFTNKNLNLSFLSPRLSLPRWLHFLDIQAELRTRKGLISTGWFLC